MKTLEDYIIAIDAKKASTVCFLRSVILSCSQKIEETTSNNTIAYYFNNYKFCYLNETSQGIEILFCDGMELCDPFNILVEVGHPVSKIPAISSTKQIDAYKIITLLQQAILLTELKQSQFKFIMRLLTK